jgi:probable F420-dependent oxidoreductase
MKVDGGLGPDLTHDLATFGASAAELQSAGYNGIWTAETNHDPFFPLLLAAQTTDSVDLGTGIAVAFSRSPMTLAATANDLQAYTGGRFILGLGSQIKPHIEKRFSMPWSHPAPRMREFILAMRAIWACWNDGEKLDFRGEFYRHTLMTPFFNPGASPYGPPRVFLGGVGAAMTSVAGEVADGLFVHPMNSPTFLRSTTLPALADGLAKSGRTRAALTIACQALVITGYDEAEFQHAETTTRMQLAFYASTPQYRVVLDAHGWGDLQPELNALAKAGRWLEMAERIDARMLAAFTVRCERPHDVPGALRERYAGLVDRLAILCHSEPHRAHPESWAEVVSRLRQG